MEELDYRADYEDDLDAEEMMREAEERETMVPRYAEIRKEFDAAAAFVGRDAEDEADEEMFRMLGGEARQYEPDEDEEMMTEEMLRQTRRTRGRRCKVARSLRLAVSSQGAAPARVVRGTLCTKRL